MQTLQRAQFDCYLQPRPRGFHKGDAGHVLIVGGDIGFSGAVRLAAEAALRVGAGLVSVATRVEHASIINVSCPELMCQSVMTATDLAPLLAKADVIVLGPGLGQAAWSQTMYAEVIKTNKPLLVDADALNLLSQHPIKKRNWVLTPHPGEASRLLRCTSADVQQDRVLAIQKLYATYGGVSVLKGAGSLVLGDDCPLAICEAGNPGMATAGMGDVLSGVIGGLLGQKIPLGDAAKLGVFVHATAGDLAAKALGERGMLASDLMPYLHEIVSRN